ncbi:hypothetical protein BgiBS90_004198 [Biomphalaria glabrata]|nr:hypothetical protein BgiBS90_004198 [Biomphalaria glabrata]
MASVKRDNCGSALLLPCPPKTRDKEDQAPFTSHLIASYTRTGVFYCPKGDPSSFPYIHVEGESLIPELKTFQTEVPGPACTY